MESMNGLSNFKKITYTSRSTPDVSHFSFLTASSESYSGSSLVEQTKNLKLSDDAHYHQRCSSESILLEEQPSWLDDLLNDSDTTLYNNGHRRSASDSYAYSVETTDKFTRQDVNISFIETKNDSLNNKINQDQKEVVYTLAIDQNREELSSKNLEGSSNIPTGSQVKPSASKTEAKRAKQHNAHRSRVRKLQYIAHLERMVENLQAQGAEVADELQFLGQKNMILVMENRALRQRLESISQEHLIKQWEQELLEREIGRIQTMYHMQKQQQQMQIHNQHQSNAKQRRNRSTKDHLDQANCFQMNSKDNCSIKSSATSSVQ